jgi:two-component system NtrC family sensor kinase
MQLFGDVVGSRLRAAFRTNAELFRNLLPRNKTMKILLVDDSRSVLAVFANRLGAFGHEVCPAENGAVAVEMFRECAPDLVLMDIEMPVMNGFEASTRIRDFETSQKWAWTPIIFLTSVDTTDNFVTSIDAGGDDLIAKNVPDAVLRAKLKAMARVAGLRQELLLANQKMENDIRLRKIAEAELSERCIELTEVNQMLSRVQQQLIQTEKLASIGQLAAGVAHEINNPIGYVLSNIGTLGNYLDNLIKVVNHYESAEPSIAAEQRSAIQSLRRDLDIDYIKNDSPVLIHESREGIGRVKRIVQDLNEFSQIGNAQEWGFADLHPGIDATLNLVAKDLQDKAEVIKDYGSLPEIECLPKQLNQVFMNLLVNAAHAMGEARGRITIRTRLADDTVCLEFVDNGCGIPDEIKAKLFDPFFTTKPVGKGSGLGLSLSYGIVKSHGGRIEVDSEVGKGSCFRVVLPLRQAR